MGRGHNSTDILYGQTGRRNWSDWELENEAEAARWELEAAQLDLTPLQLECLASLYRLHKGLHNQYERGECVSLGTAFRTRHIAQSLRHKQLDSPELSLEEVEETLRQLGARKLLRTGTDGDDLFWLDRGQQVWMSEQEPMLAVYGQI